MLVRKGFLLTIDALFALAVVSVAAYSLVLTQNQQGFEQGFPSLEALGRDFLYLNASGVPIDETSFRELTGMNVSRAPFAEPNPAVVAHSVLYYYPAICECDKGLDCAPATNACANGWDATPANAVLEAWVTP